MGRGGRGYEGEDVALRRGGEMSAENREAGRVGRTNLGCGVHPVTDAAGDGGHDEPVAPVAPRWSVECQCLFLYSAL